MPQKPRVSTSRRTRLFVALASMAAVVTIALIVLRACGLLRPFSVPTGAMIPAISPGDRIVMEGITFLSRQPRHGDVVVFKTDGIDSLPPRTFYVKRVAGEPGDRVRLSGDKLFISGAEVLLSNVAGRIVYELPPGAAGFAQTNVTVPLGSYFVLGDNSTNSSDSRFWGSVPRSNIIGRVSFRYWPPQKIGKIK